MVQQCGRCPNAAGARDGEDVARGAELVARGCVRGQGDQHAHAPEGAHGGAAGGAGVGAGRGGAAGGHKARRPVAETVNSEP
jgi:hypothetical protein